MTKSMPIDSIAPPEPPGAATRLRAMLSHAEEVRELEKQRLARELHNDFGSALTALAMRLAILARQPAGEGATEQWAKANALLAELTRTARRVQAELRPGVLNVAGLSMALEEALEDFAEQEGIGYSLKLPEEELRLEQERAIALYRMFQEMLSNVRRHAKASRVDVALACEEGRLQLSVVDDGSGFEPAQTDFSATHGLRRIAERAEFLGGEMRLQSAPQRGTAISVILPLADGADADTNTNFLTSTIGKP
jgi:signal transduction histidine kinase